MRFYDALKKAGKNFEIVWVSRDREAEDLLEYYQEKQGPWFYLEFGNPLIQELLAKYEVKTIPALKVVKWDGTIVVNDARTEVAERGGENPEDLFDEWCSFL
uniref:Thioredoxin domain-containing protein n=1 Tax=Panagrolaimus sp. JU765 TaxID=591449 RepID=A0AC34QGN0_9BILA